MNDTYFGFILIGWILGSISVGAVWFWWDAVEEKEDEIDTLRENLLRVNLKINDLRYDFTDYKEKTNKEANNE